MSAAELLAKLSDLGIRIAADGEYLSIEAPRGTITPQLKAALLERKSELLGLLGEPPLVRAHLCAGCKKYFFLEPTMICYWCRRSRRAPCLSGTK